MNLKELASKHGIENLVFLLKMKPVRTVFGLIAYKSSNDAEVLVPCVVDASSRYGTDLAYKVTLKAMEEIYGRDTFYVSDLEQIIGTGQIQLLVKPS